MLFRIARPFFLFIAVLLAFTASAAAGSEAAFALHASRGDDGALRLVWTIAPGNYLYRDRITATNADGSPLALTLPEGEIKDDPNFGRVAVFHSGVETTIPSSALTDAEKLRVTYQGCAEQGICFPPATREVDLSSLAVSAVQPGALDLGAIPDAPENPPAPAVNSETSLTSSLTGSRALLFASFLGFGLLLAFTPCVLPMVPILMGMLSRSGERLSAWRGLSLSLAYVLAMAAAYAALGVAAAWSGQNLQVALQTPIALGLMALVMLGLALASFGIFELSLPSRLTARFTGHPTDRFGPLLGAGALGFTSALIVGPCVTPPLAAALLYVAQTGDAARGALALFALGLGMGLPLLAVGTFGAGILPRSGPWLQTSRNLFGLVFLGVALVLASRVLPDIVSMALWALLAIGTGVFIGAFHPLTAASGRVRHLGKALGIAAIVYGAVLLIGGAAGSGDPLRPLDALVRPASAVPERQAAGTVVRSPAELRAALAEARTTDRPILVDFTADWCTACRTVEREVFADPGIRRRLDAFTVIRADVTRTNAGTAALMRDHAVAGPPTFLLLDPRTGSEISAARMVGEVAAKTFGRTLDRVGASPRLAGSQPANTQWRNK